MNFLRVRHFSCIASVFTTPRIISTDSSISCLKDMLVPNKAVLFHLFWFHYPSSLVLGTELCWDVEKKNQSTVLLSSLSESHRVAERQASKVC